MADAGIADLDELILKCRSPKARSFISEAVKSYRAGAFRSSIVATWIAVSYDFIEKLRDLDLSGDAQAKKYLAEFEKIHSNPDISAALRFERQILDRAREMELISDLEQQDLVRLREDRDRCAHPSMNSIDEPYEPPPELARVHLRNAIVNMLQHPPVQGKAALDRLMNEVDSDYFPFDEEKAFEFLRHSPLAKPRLSLIRNFVLLLLKRIFGSDPLSFALVKYAGALNATRKLHREAVERTLEERLSEMIGRLSNESLPIVFDSLTWLPDVWQFVKDDAKVKLNSFLDSCLEEDLKLIIVQALDMEDLRSAAIARISGLSKETMVSLIRSGARREYTDRAIYLYAMARNFREANEMGEKMIIPLVDLFDELQVDRLSAAAKKNSQISESIWWKQVSERLSNRA